MEGVDKEASEGDVEELEIAGIIGFDGTTIRGLIVHPDETHLIYALGNKVIIHNSKTKHQEFLSAHTNIVSTIDVSRSGKYIASGQINHIGFKARVIVWDFATRAVIGQHDLHKVRVETVAFSLKDTYLFSTGGRDCGFLVVWDVALGQVICGCPVSRSSQGEATTTLSMNRRDPCFATGGDNHLAVWHVDSESRKLNCFDVSIGKVKRTILCMVVNERDELCYCGTATGDVLKIRLNYHHDPDVMVSGKNPLVLGCFTRITKRKLPVGQVDLYSGGVRSIKRLFAGPLLIGAGDGTVELVQETGCKLPKQDADLHIKFPSVPALGVMKSTKVFASVTSLQILKQETMALAGTSNSEIFSLNLTTFAKELLVTCHTSTIYDLAFPYNFSEVFATASKHDVRVWSMNTFQELLRIRVPNFSASSVLFSHDGKAILTAWNDGVIRSFTPLTGRLIYAIPNAHNKGVSALVINHEGTVLVSGGCEGQVRMWSVSPQCQQLVCTLKEHKAPISAIDINKAGTEAVSACTDGTCILWDLVRQCRRQILFGATLFMCVKYFPTDVQLLTGGTDRKISYWEVLDGSLVRELEGSQSGAINCLDISLDGSVFVSGGNDQIVKVWKYQEGITTHIGSGHTAVATSARFSPDQRHIVTTSGSGSIFIWKCPYEFTEPAPTEPPTPPSRASSKQKEELIQDLPSARSEPLDVSPPFCKCVCPQVCPKTKKISKSPSNVSVAGSKASSRRKGAATPQVDGTGDKKFGRSFC